ncbi:MAG: hypothetical protein AB7V46_23675 [Thermomicrobiales bacterium]
MGELLSSLGDVTVDRIDPHLVDLVPHGPGRSAREAPGQERLDGYLDALLDGSRIDSLGNL